MADPRRFNFPCEFGNAAKTYAWADSGASIKLMSYSFYQKLKLPEMKNTKMEIHLEN